MRGNQNKGDLKKIVKEHINVYDILEFHVFTKNRKPTVLTNIEKEKSLRQI